MKLTMSHNGLTQIGKNMIRSLGTLVQNLHVTLGGLRPVPVRARNIANGAPIAPLQPEYQGDQHSKRH